MTEFVLSPKERQALKARAHALDPVVLMGSQGLTDAVKREIDRALLAHELVKVRVPGDDRDERERLFSTLAIELSAARVQMIGKLLVLYRPRPEEPAAEPAAKERGRTRHHGTQRPAQSSAGTGARTQRPRARPARRGR
jgi:putative YhbY family RNA-binding protein